MFKQVVMLKVDPWYLYTDGEEDTLKVAERFGDKVSGIVTGQDIIVRIPRKTLTLQPAEVFLIEHEQQDKVHADNLDEVTEREIAAASKELEDEFAKLQSSLD